jgi:hypothetical protein
MSKKRRLTDQQEFEVMKLVLDKFLLVAFVVMGYGMFVSIRDNSFQSGLYFLIAGAIIFFLFLVIIVKEYEIHH